MNLIFDIVDNDIKISNIETINTNVEEFNTSSPRMFTSKSVYIIISK